jgi:hypothetical protein
MEEKQKRGNAQNRQRQAQARLERRIITEYARQAGRLACTGPASHAAIREAALLFMAHSPLLQVHLHNQRVCPAVVSGFLAGWREAAQTKTPNERA